LKDSKSEESSSSSDNPVLQAVLDRYPEFRESFTQGEANKGDLFGFPDFYMQELLVLRRRFESRDGREDGPKEARYEFIASVPTFATVQEIKSSNPVVIQRKEGEDICRRIERAYEMPRGSVASYAIMRDSGREEPFVYAVPNGYLGQPLYVAETMNEEQTERFLNGDDPEGIREVLRKQLADRGKSASEDVAFNLEGPSRTKWETALKNRQATWKTERESDITVKRVVTGLFQRALLFDASNPNEAFASLDMSSDSADVVGQLLRKQFDQRYMGYPSETLNIADIVKDAQEWERATQRADLRLQGATALKLDPTMPALRALVLDGEQRIVASLDISTGSKDPLGQLAGKLLPKESHELNPCLLEFFWEEAVEAHQRALLSRNAENEDVFAEIEGRVADLVAQNDSEFGKGKIPRREGPSIFACSVNKLPGETTSVAGDEHAALESYLNSPKGRHDGPGFRIKGIPEAADIYSEDEAAPIVKSADITKTAGLEDVAKRLSRSYVLGPVSERGYLPHVTIDPVEDAKIYDAVNRAVRNGNVDIRSHPLSLKNIQFVDASYPKECKVLGDPEIGFKQHPKKPVNPEYAEQLTLDALGFSVQDEDLSQQQILGLTLEGPAISLTPALGTSASGSEHWGDNGEQEGLEFEHWIGFAFGLGSRDLSSTTASRVSLLSRFSGTRSRGGSATQNVPGSPPLVGANGPESRFRAWVRGEGDSDLIYFTRTPSLEASRVLSPQQSGPPSIWDGPSSTFAERLRASLNALGSQQPSMQGSPDATRSRAISDPALLQPPSRRTPSRVRSRGASVAGLGITFEGNEGTVGSQAVSSGAPTGGENTPLRADAAGSQERDDSAASSAPSSARPRSRRRFFQTLRRSFHFRGTPSPPVIPEGSEDQAAGIPGDENPPSQPDNAALPLQGGNVESQEAPEQQPSRRPSFFGQLRPLRVLRPSEELREAMAPEAAPRIRILNIASIRADLANRTRRGGHTRSD